MSGQTIDSSALLEAAEHHKRQAWLCQEWIRTHPRARNYEHEAARGQMADHKNWEKAMRLAASNAELTGCKQPEKGQA